MLKCKTVTLDFSNSLLIKSCSCLCLSDLNSELLHKHLSEMTNLLVMNLTYHFQAQVEELRMSEAAETILLSHSESPERSFQGGCKQSLRCSQSVGCAD